MMTSHGDAPRQMACLETDAHVLLASMHRQALIMASNCAGRHFQGLSVAGKQLNLSNTWRRKLRSWDAALGLCEKITKQAVEEHLDKLGLELKRVAPLGSREAQDPEPQLLDDTEHEMPIGAEHQHLEPTSADSVLAQLDAREAAITRQLDALWAHVTQSTAVPPEVATGGCRGKLTVHMSDASTAAETQADEHDVTEAVQLLEYQKEVQQQPTAPCTPRANASAQRRSPQKRRCKRCGTYGITCLVAHIASITMAILALVVTQRGWQTEDTWHPKEPVPNTEYQAMFANFDADQSGCLDMDEVADILEQEGIEYTKQDLVNARTSFGNQHGCIELEMFPKLLGQS